MFALKILLCFKGPILISIGIIEVGKGTGSWVLGLSNPDAK